MPSDQDQAMHTSVYSSSVGNSIQTSAKKRDSQNVGCTGPITHARPPGFVTRYACHTGLVGTQGCRKCIHCHARFSENASMIERECRS